MKAIKHETSGWSDPFETEKDVVFIELTLTTTIEQDLLSLNSRPLQIRAFMHRKSKVLAPETAVDISLRSPMKACIRAMWYC